MSSANYIVCGSAQEVARAFATEVRENYQKFLEFWINELKDDEEVHQHYLARLENEPEIVEKNAYAKILLIMKKRKQYKEYYRGFLFFRSLNNIIISNETHFYDDLLDGDGIAYAFMMDSTYVIDKKENTIQKLEK